MSLGSVKTDARESTLAATNNQATRTSPCVGDSVDRVVVGKHQTRNLGRLLEHKRKRS